MEFRVINLITAYIFYAIMGCAQNAPSAKEIDGLREFVCTLKSNFEDIVEWKPLKHDSIIMIEKLGSQFQRSFKLEASQKSEIKNSGKTENSKNTYVWLCLELFFGVGIGILCWEKWLRERFLFFLFKKNSQKNSEKKYLEENTSLKKEIKHLKQQNKDLQQENDIIRQECSEKQVLIEKAFQKLRENKNISPKIFSENEPGIVTIPIESTLPIKDLSILYADSIINGFFNKVCENPNENSIFDLRMQGRQYATFVVYSDAYPLVIQRPEFLDGCEKQIVGSDTIKVISRGRAQKQTDGRWKITKKLNIIIS